MKKLASSLLIPLLLLATTLQSHAQLSFNDGVIAYEEERFEDAFNIFFPLAKFGHPDSQNNIAAFYQNSIGTEQDDALANGWIRAAESNGAVVNLQTLQDRYRQLTPDQQLASNDIFFEYNKTSLLRHLIPTWNYCEGIEPAKRLQIAAFSFPTNTPYPQEAVVQVSVLIGKDSIPRDPVVISAVPNEPQLGFERNAVRAIMQSSFQAATQDGSPIEQRMYFFITFSYPENGVLWDIDNINTYKEYADNGDHQAQFILGQSALLDDSLGITTEKAQQWIVNAAQAGISDAQRYLAYITDNSDGCSGNTKSSQWFAAAAKNGDHESMVMTAEHLLNEKSTDYNLIQSYLSSATEHFLNDEEPSDYILIHLSAIFASHPIEGIRNPELALQLAEQIRQSSNPDPQAMEVLAAAHAAQGNYRRAVRIQKRAINKADDANWNTAAMRSRLLAWEEEQSWYGDLLAVIVDNDN